MTNSIWQDNVYNIYVYFAKQGSDMKTTKRQKDIEWSSSANKIKTYNSKVLNYNPLAASASAHTVLSRPGGVWLCSWSRTRILWWFPCASSHCQNSCMTAICRSWWHGRPTFVHAQFVLVSAASAHPQNLCGTTFRMNWRTATLGFLQRVSIACYAERCISHDRFCLTVWPSDRPTVCHRRQFLANKSPYLENGARIGP